VFSKEAEGAILSNDWRAGETIRTSVLRHSDKCAIVFPPAAVAAQ
jgi:hypothetical protein